MSAGIASNGNEKMLEAYNNGCKEIDDTVKKMDPYLAKHPTLNRIMQEEDIPTIEEIQRFYDKQIVKIKSGGLEEARKNLSAGKELFDKYRGIHKKINESVDDITKREWNSTNDASIKTKVYFRVIFIVSLLLGIMIAVLIVKSIASRLITGVTALNEVA